VNSPSYPAAFLAEIDAGWNAPFSGWDFRWLEGKFTEEPLPWDYLALARERLHGIQGLLDMDTGGGEIFSALAPFPPFTCATEMYAPNIPLARARLEPLGVKLVVPEDDMALPFGESSFELVLNRHGGYQPGEIFRILKPGGRFLTQQVGGENQIRLNQLLQDEVRFMYSYWTCGFAEQQLRENGFEILLVREAHPAARFYSLSAVVYLLRIISWQVEDFEPASYLERLYRIYCTIQKEGALETSEHRFLIEARKP
jgi:SAM-dependent methyltransferase